MVEIKRALSPALESLSVLALSSRFDGLLAIPPSAVQLCILSVLALSSRFDGLLQTISTAPMQEDFQYSLCRVVLMVDGRLRYQAAFELLSVLALSSRFDGLTGDQGGVTGDQLSVLALSSRFDGPHKTSPPARRGGAFSTRSVESF